MTELYGFGGAHESGKTTAAKVLADVASPYSYVHHEFSEPISEIAQRWLINMTHRDLHDRAEQVRQLRTELQVALSGASVKEVPRPTLDPLNDIYVAELIDGSIDFQIRPETKVSHRPLLEWLGRTAIELVSPTVWSDLVADKVSKGKENGIDLITVGGVRTAADFNAIKSLGGTVIRLHRGVSDNRAPSEYQLGQWAADYEISNNGTIQELTSKIAEIWNHRPSKNVA